jgi:hypothetical protein
MYMPIDVVSNNPTYYLKKIDKQHSSDNDNFQDFVDGFNIGPAYIVEISARGRQLLQSQGSVNIVHL